MRSFRRSFSARQAALLLTLCAAAAPAAAEDSGWSFSAGADYTNGDYGSDQETSILVAPFSAVYGNDRWRAGLTVTYVTVEGAPGVVPGATGALGSGGPLSSVTDPLFGGDVAQDPILAPEIEEQGLGDTTLEIAFTPYVGEHGTRFSMSGAARLPTGDEDRSLGAGETVLSAGAGVAQPLGERVALYGAVGYTHATESDGGGAFAGAGVEGRVADGVLLGAAAEWSQARVAGTPERTQATLYSSFALTDDVRVAAYVLGGLSESAPDFGGGIRLTLR